MSTTDTFIAERQTALAEAIAERDVAWQALSGTAPTHPEASARVAAWSTAMRRVTECTNHLAGLGERGAR